MADLDDLLDSLDRFSNVAAVYECLSLAPSNYDATQARERWTRWEQRDRQQEVVKVDGWSCHVVSRIKR